MESMSNMPPLLQTHLQHARIGIWYLPLVDEPDPTHIPFPPSMRDDRITLSNMRGTDPVQIAQEVTRDRETLTAYVLVPGRWFDRRGTRHGRGGGWYDRFLQALPEAWIRIGVCTPGQMSCVQLQRNTWDQPVDWLFIERSDGWVFFPTDARMRNMPHDKGHCTDPRQAT